MKRTILIILVFLVITACGSRGDLILEPESLPLKITDFKVSQIGKELVLEFSYPEFLSDSSPLNRDDISKVFVYRSEEIIPEEAFRKKGKLVLKYKEPKKEIISNSDGKFFIKIPMKIKNLDRKKYFFGIVYYKKRNRSPVSVIKSISTIIPYPAVDNFTVTSEKKIILLKWKLPKFDIAGNEISAVSGYNIYRKSEILKNDSKVMVKSVENLPKEPVFKRVNVKTVKNEYYEDTDIIDEGKYTYKVSIAYNNKIESEFSKEISIDIKDIYPPDVPENLFVFKGKGFMLLNWDEVKDKDFSHYVVYRSRKNQGEFKIIADNVKKSRFKDENVKKRIVYFYYVTAVDNKNNESEASNIAKESY